MPVLTQNRVFFATVQNDGEEETASKFSGFPFPVRAVTNDDWESSYKFLTYHGPFTIQEVAELYWRGRKISATISGNASISGYDPSGAPPIAASISTSGFDIERPSITVERDLILFRREWNDSGGVSDTTESAFSCTFTGSPVDQPYYVEANAFIQVEMFRTSDAILLREDGSYYVYLKITGSIGVSWETSGDCSPESFSVEININGPVESGEDYTATVFGKDFKMQNGGVTFITLVGPPAVSIAGFNALTLDFNEYWTYLNSEGDPVYNDATGSPLVDPRS